VHLCERARIAEPDDVGAAIGGRIGEKSHMTFHAPSAGETGCRQTRGSGVNATHPSAVGRHVARAQAA
jgi:hypothetical protein